MIEKEKIRILAQTAIDSILKEKAIEITAIEISRDNTVSLFIDNISGICIDDCTTISKAVEEGLDREIEDFELTVSSAGISSPFTVLLQYKKNIGKEIVVDTNLKKRIKGILKTVETECIELEIIEKLKIEGKKKKQEQIVTLKISFDEIKTAKLVF